MQRRAVGDIATFQQRRALLVQQEAYDLRIATKGSRIEQAATRLMGIRSTNHERKEQQAEEEEEEEEKKTQKGAIRTFCSCGRSVKDWLWHSPAARGLQDVHYHGQERSTCMSEQGGWGGGNGDW